MTGDCRDPSEEMQRLLRRLEEMDETHAPFGESPERFEVAERARPLLELGDRHKPELQLHSSGPTECRSVEGENICAEMPGHAAAHPAAVAPESGKAAPRPGLAPAPQQGTMKSADLQRVREHLQPLHEAIEACRLPPAAQLAPIPGPRQVGADGLMQISGGVEPPTEMCAETVRRSHRKHFGFTKLLVASSISAALAWYFAPRRVQWIVDETGTPGFRVADARVETISSVRRFEQPSTEVDRSAASDEPAHAVLTVRPTRNVMPAKDDPGATSLQTNVDLGASVPIGRAMAALEVAPSDQNLVLSASPTRNAAIANIGALDPPDIPALIDRGRQYFDAGDMAAARLLFNRAAMAGDATAAVAMGTTYDPAMLESRGVRGMRGDPERAQSWYAKAAQLGSQEGRRLLEALQERARGYDK